jgi:hypothetical protein
MLSVEEGIKAIIKLQAVAGIEEPEERARKAWENFTDEEKKQTEAVYNIMINE